jgi:fatty-acyl-CoA synthase
MLAVMDLGGVFVPVDPRLADAERAWVLDDLRPAAVVAAEEGMADYARMPHVPLLLGAGDGETDIAELTSARLATERAPLAAAELALILYTSGTTGRAKGVMHSHYTLASNAANLRTLLDARPDDVGLAMTPMFHTAGLNTAPGYLWSVGGSVVVIPRMDGPAVIDAIVRHGVTRIDTVTAALAVLHRTPGFGDADISRVRTLLVGGASIPEEQVARFAASGARVFMAAGMTECCVVSALAPEKVVAKPGSVGKPLTTVETRLVDPASARQVTSSADVGEWCIRGPAVTTGYWRDPSRTRAAIDDENWFHTGDLGRYDADGDLYLVGRMKDVIKTGGESVGAAEVETVISRHPAVTACAVFGLPHERWGETVVAVICVDDDAAPSLEELRAFCGPHLAQFKLPTRLVVAESLPQTASGKVAKYVLRDRLLAGQSGG